MGTFLTMEGACLPVARGLGQEAEARLKGAGRPWRCAC